MEKKIQELVRQMTLEEKAGMCSGADFWHTKAIERLGIPSIMMSDGPHGLRKQEDDADHLGINESIEAVCFPAGCAMAASFDKELLQKIGETIGEEAQATDVGIVLGPAMNIKRSPLCGRNFEYYSEDPYVSSEMAAAFIEGVQSKNVGTSPKHFAVNNQEYHRMSSSSEVDERTFHEIYLASFENAIKSAKPWTVMNSYNKVNGTYACENKELLTDVLREKWGFEGFVVTDWGAMNEKIDALRAGCDLEMPYSYGITDAQVVEAVRSGELSESVLDEACRRILNIVFRYASNRDNNAKIELERDHEIAQFAAEQSIVMLKNDEEILPLNKDKKVAFIGQYAEKPRFQGGGSSHINCFKVTSALEAAKECNVVYAQGFDDSATRADVDLLKEAVEVARCADIVVLFVGLPDLFESEGYDRKHMSMPDNQLELIQEVTKVQKNVVVVLHNGSPIEMPWINDVKGVVEAYLGGQAVGTAVKRILYGEVNPSGRLAESFPKRLQDTPCYLNYGGENDRSVYSEGVFVGYRYYDKKEMEVLFPFGYGLSYTTFSYDNLRVEKKKMTDEERIRVEVDITNTGKVTGKEVVQLYVSPMNSDVIRPIKELKGFKKVELQPGETKMVCFCVDKQAFSYWNTEIHDWYVESGEYKILIGASSRNILAETVIVLENTVQLPINYTLNTPLGTIMKNPRSRVILEQMLPQNDMATQGESEAITQELMAAMMESMPLRQMAGLVPGIKLEDMENLIMLLNQN